LQTFNANVSPATPDPITMKSLSIVTPYFNQLAL
jgi:hypothetical protein